MNVIPVTAFCLFALAASMPTSGTVLLTLDRQWQGAWVVRDADYRGSVQAWNVHGSTVDVYDPVVRRTELQHFTLESPCRLVRLQSLDRGAGVVMSRNTFAFAPDGLHVAPAQAGGGLRRGTLLMACIDDHVYTFDTRSRQCLRWNRAMSGSPTATAQCAVSPPSFVLRHFTGGEDVFLNFAGDALLSTELAAQVSERQASFHSAIQRAEVLSAH